MKIPCPHCNSVNTKQHSDNQIYEEHGIAQASYRCNRCKKQFFRRWQLVSAEYKFHPYLTWNPNYRFHQPTSNEPYMIINPERDDPPKDNTGRY